MHGLRVEGLSYEGDSAQEVHIVCSLKFAKFVSFKKRIVHAIYVVRMLFIYHIFI